MKLFYTVFGLIIGLLCSQSLHAQHNRNIPLVKIRTDSTSQKIKKDTTVLSQKGTPQTDIYEIIGRIFHKNAAPADDSITSAPVISIVPAIGYTLVSKLAAVLSGNVAFRTGPNSRVSTAVASISYTQNKQFSVPIQTSIWSRNNKFNYIGDYRFYKYPQSTFGLGSSSTMANEDPMDYNFFRFYETAYRRITGNWYAGIGYLFDDHYHISDKGNTNGTVADYALYGRSTHSVASGFTFSTFYDSRDNGINPAKGSYASLQYRSSVKVLGSTSSWQSLMVDARKYFKFPAGSDNVIALWNFDWIILNGSPGYLDLPSVGWDANSATGRGYIQGRFRGAQMIYAEAEYRFRILANGLIGGVVFVNAESFSAAQGTRLQAIQPAFGPGLRIKLNKVSKTSIAFDYGFGTQGSKGLFIDVGEAF
ncbi:BamA/TamA family outer membrane protein [Mucilaginibacter sp. UR6-11]|uniref:BamA/TamA family outer membrane protein n=1 Tax=Mucilaginibacter sp. UR6-11 TaxID=1435644 RepID=UPI001E318EB0|nr:BamA/TamA family outer membrane protein [Mucilaginibacter sp. UR6-11]MCC8425580.1 outer membrane protein assembly factor [Mucilaginibacter sp. UR6-11]